jgi:hypothetical protein
MDRTNVLLQVYVVERQHQQTLLQLITALVTVLATYVVASVGFAVHDCGQHVHVGNGCSAIPAPVAWLAPAPGIAILAFFTALRVLYAASVGYTRRVERDITKEMRCVGIAPVPMPRSLVGETESVVKRLPDIAFGFTYILAAIYIMAVELVILPWTHTSSSAISTIVGAIYLGITAFCAASRPIALRKHIKPMFQI